MDNAQNRLARLEAAGGGGSLHIDIETFCPLDLTKVGVYRYVEDPSFEVLLICWELDGVVGEWRVWEGDIAPPELRQAFLTADRFVAFNAQFERVCLAAARFKLGLTDRVADRRMWFCAQAQAFANGLPGKLETCGQAMGFGGKHERGRKAMLKLCKPRKPSKNNPATRWTYATAAADYEALVEYCHHDVELERQIWNATGKLSDSEQELYWLDQKINDRGVRVDLPNVRQAERVGIERKRELNRKAKKFNLTLSQTAEIAKRVGVESVSKDVLVELLEGDLITDELRELLLLRQEFARTSVSKFSAMLRSVCGDQRLRGMFQFAGAGATNRWAGRIVQLQNLVRKGEADPETAIERLYAPAELELLYGDVMGLLSRLIRPMLVSETGDLLICDYSAIEARVLGWIADCGFYMDAYRADGKLYEAMASRVYGVAQDAVSSSQRHLGKTIILGCGFQMGEEKFISTARDQGADEPDDILTRGHSEYRGNVPEIVALWYQLQDAALWAVRHPGRSVRVKGLKLAVRGDWMYMLLPSGRPLAYYQPEASFDPDFKRWGVTYMGLDSYTHQWKRIRTYGGKLTENAVQATARDLLGHAMKTVDDRDGRIVAHVHDELVLERQPGQTPDWLSAAMCELPHWAEGLPIGAEAKLQKRYSK